MTSSPPHTRTLLAPKPPQVSRTLRSTAHDIDLFLPGAFSSLSFFLSPLDFFKKLIDFYSRLTLIAALVIPAPLPPCNKSRIEFTSLQFIREPTETKEREAREKNRGQYEKGGGGVTRGCLVPPRRSRYGAPKWRLPDKTSPVYLVFIAMQKS
ncbi:hypothetical protein J6590_021484 [Homalodisca vitripennis]|nr:hypothetical protein J6590_021484 [Homalodisca vitripennis]